MPRQEMDEAASRTMFLGLAVGLFLYGLSFVVVRLLPGETGQVLSLVLTFASMIVVLGWFFAVRRGFRLVGKPINRGERRARDHKKREREKKLKFR